MPPKEVGNIPGYYYDSEKGKYFKIAAHSSPLAYSSGKVKDKQLRDQKVVEDKAYKHERKKQIKRADILNGLSGDLLFREYGIDSRMNTAGMFAEGLRNKFCISFLHLAGGHPGLVADVPRPNPVSTIVPANSGRSHVDIAIASDNTFDRVRIRSLAGQDSCKMRRRSLCVIKAGMVLRSNAFATFFAERGVATSISINHYHQFYTQTWLSGTASSGIVLIPIDWLDNDSSASTPTMHGPISSRYASSQTCIDINCSVSAPAASGSLFLYGTSENIIFMTKEGRILCVRSKSEHSNLVGQTPKWPLTEDIFALEFQDKHPDIVFSGNRKGLIPTLDLRDVGQAATLIHHPSAITHIRSINYKLIVSGLKSQMCQYDTRFLKREDVIVGPRITSPVLTYPEYFNEAHIRHGFDVDVESGLIAVAQPPSPVHNMVQLFSLNDGCALASSLLTSSVQKHYDDYPEHSVMPPIYNGLQFVDDDPGSPKSLYALSGGHLERYAWHGMGEDGD